MADPTALFKVEVFIYEGQLATTGYVADQTPQLDELPDVPHPEAIEAVPPLGPFRTFQTPARDMQS